MDIDLEELAAIIELLDKTEFTQFRFEKGDLQIAVSRGGAPLDGPAPAAATVAASDGQSVTPTAPAALALAVPAPAAPVAGGLDEGTLAADEVVVRSPMLGTFYRSPKPGEAPFVGVGDRVDADSVLGIVEVMKLMNSISAGIAGELTKILVSDADLVEFEQPLFVVRRLS